MNHFKPEDIFNEEEIVYDENYSNLLNKMRDLKKFYGKEAVMKAVNEVFGVVIKLGEKK